MAIKIEWIDRNVGVIQFNLYRSDTVIPDSPLPTPLAVVPAGVFAYQDLSAPRNRAYHYRVGTVTAEGEILSSDAVLANMPYTGPGPQILMRGTWDNGYFGRLALADLFSAVELLNVCGLNVAYAVAATAYWGKYVYKGKILYFPDGGIGGTQVSWESLYQNGVVYGTIPSADWPASVKSTYGTIPQAKQVNKGEHAFIVRLPQTRAPFTGTGITIPDIVTGEIDQCFGRAYLNRTLPVSQPTLVAVAQVDDLVNVNTYFHCADFYSVGNAYRRGGSSFDLSSTAPLNNAGSTVWRPVLELVL